MWLWACLGTTCSGNCPPNAPGWIHRGHNVIGGSPSHLWAFWRHHIWECDGGSSSGHPRVRQQPAQRASSVRGRSGPAGHRREWQRRSITCLTRPYSRLDVTLADIWQRAPRAIQFLGSICFSAASQNWAGQPFGERWDRWCGTTRMWILDHMESWYKIIHIVCV